MSDPDGDHDPSARILGIEFRGKKGNLYEGGLRIPSIVRWPGKIKAGKVSDLIFYQPDIFHTLTELTGATAPMDIDGLSILPTLLGEKSTGHPQELHNMLYWEHRQQIAVRMSMLVAIRIGFPPRLEHRLDLLQSGSD